MICKHTSIYFITIYYHSIPYTLILTITDGTDMFHTHLAWFGYVYPVLNCGEAKYPDVCVKDTG